MPMACVSACLTPRCPNNGVIGGFCPAHARQKEAARRGSAAVRGYDRRWAAYSLWFRSRHPLCGDSEPNAYTSTASLCKAHGRTTAVLGYTYTANGHKRPNGAVHHIQGHSGPADIAFMDPRNHESLCSRCHNKVTDDDRTQ